MGRNWKRNAASEHDNRLKKLRVWMRSFFFAKMLDFVKYSRYTQAVEIERSG